MPQPSSILDQLMSFFQNFLVTKAPFTLPSNVKEFIVKIAPWAAIVVAVLALPLILGVLGLGSLFMSYGVYGNAYGYGYGLGMLSLLLIGVTIVMELIAVPGLFKRAMKSWMLLYYAVLIRAVADLIDLSLISFIFNIIPLYLLFQVKSLYRNP